MSIIIFNLFYTFLLSRRVSPTRRSSDVSTIGLEEKPVFRPIRNGKPPKQPKSADPLDTLFPKPKSNTSYTTQLSEPSRQNSKQSNKSQLLNKRRITPNSLPTTAKVRMIFTSKQRSVRECSVHSCSSPCISMHFRSKQTKYKASR